MEEVREIVCLDCSYTMKAFFQNLENRIITRHIPGWRAAPWRSEQIVGSAHGTR